MHLKVELSPTRAAPGKETVNGDPRPHVRQWRVDRSRRRSRVRVRRPRDGTGRWVGCLTAARPRRAWRWTPPPPRSRDGRRCPSEIAAPSSIASALGWSRSATTSPRLHRSGKRQDPSRRRRSEVAFALGYFGWFAEESAASGASGCPRRMPGKRLWVFHQPVGPVAAITPPEFPVHHGHPQDRARARRRLPGGAQARLGHAAHRAGPGRDLPRGRAARRRLQRGDEQALVGGGGGDPGRCAHPQDRLHRLHRSGQVDHGARGQAGSSALSFELGGNAPSSCGSTTPTSTRRWRARWPSSTCAWAASPASAPTGSMCSRASPGASSPPSPRR